MTGGELTLGALLVRLDEREREISAQAGATREKIAELTALLGGLDTAAEEIRITRKTRRRTTAGRRSPGRWPCSGIR